MPPTIGDKTGSKSSRVETELSVVLEMGDDGAETMPVVLRPLRSAEDYRQCEQLERETWGQNFTECVPASILMISQKVGGIAAGAFDSDGRMVGMIYGLTGPRHGALAHWSHMLAVSRELRSRGLGRELKLYQRRAVLAKGVHTMLWTYDPLVAKNAYLNICRLGARPIEYVRDLYGPDTSSALHQGLGTDRLVVEWRLDQAKSVPPSEASGWASVAVVNADADGNPQDEPGELPPSPRLRVEIPLDIQPVKASAEGAGALWRASTRGAFESCLEAGYAVTGFQRDETSDRCWYLLERGGTG